MTGVPDEHADEQADAPGGWDTLLSIMERLAGTNDLGEILALINDALRDGLGAERATVFRFDATAGQLIAEQAHGVSGLRLPADVGIAGQTLRTGVIINVPDCYDDERFGREVDKRTGFRTRSMLSVPLVTLGADGQTPEVLGVAQALNKRTDGDGDDAVAPFTPEDERFARAVASQAAVAMRRSRLLAAERERDRMAAEMRVARLIQASSMPTAMPAIDGYDVAVRRHTATEAGGDVVDLVLAPPDGDGDPALRVFVGDATGHGVGPAIASARAAAMFHIGARVLDVASIMAMIDAELEESLPVGRFVAAAAARLHPDSGLVEVVAAGLGAVAVLPGDAREPAVVIEAMRPPLALGRGDRVEALHTRLTPGDALVILSDGYTDPLSGAGQRSIQPVLSVLPRNVSAETLAHAIDDHAARAGAGDDDQTMVIVKRGPINRRG